MHLQIQYDPFRIPAAFFSFLIEIDKLILKSMKNAEDLEYSNKFKNKKDLEDLDYWISKFTVKL